MLHGLLCTMWSIRCTPGNHELLALKLRSMASAAIIRCNNYGQSNPAPKSPETLGYVCIRLVKSPMNGQRSQDWGTAAKSIIQSSVGNSRGSVQITTIRCLPRVREWIRSQHRHDLGPHRCDYRYLHSIVLHPNSKSKRVRRHFRAVQRSEKRFKTIRSRDSGAGLLQTPVI